VNAAGGGAPSINIVGVDFQIVVRDTTTQIVKTVTVSRNGRVLSQK
jgi:hypothetical protein